MKESWFITFLIVFYKICLFSINISANLWCTYAIFKKLSDNLCLGKIEIMQFTELWIELEDILNEAWRTTNTRWSHFYVP